MRLTGGVQAQRAAWRLAGGASHRFGGSPVAPWKGGGIGRLLRPSPRRGGDSSGDVSGGSRHRLISGRASGALVALGLRPSFGLWPSCFVILLALSVLSASAQTYSIEWSKVSGGGGTSTGGVYAVSGTLGQHDAGTPMSGGNFSLTGGFWSFLSLVQTTGSPLLSIRYTTTNTAVVSWPSPSTGFNLQFATDLTLSNWANSVTAPSDDGTNRFLIVNPPTGNGFFRLIKP